MSTYLLLIVTFIFFIILLKNKNLFFKNNNKLKNFKNSFTSKESKIEKIFTRNNERIISDPNLNIVISIYDKEEEANLKTNMHRARLFKFNKSKLNGEFIYKDKGNNFYKIINEKKEYI